MTTKAQRDNIRRQAIAAERREVKRKAGLRAEQLRRPDYFAADLVKRINALSTDLRRLHRDKAAPHIAPEQREAIAAAAASLAKLLPALQADLAAAADHPPPPPALSPLQEVVAGLQGIAKPSK